MSASDAGKRSGRASGLVRKLAPYLFWAALAIAFACAVAPQPPALPGNPSDKVQHMLAFAVLGGLAWLAYPGLSRWRILIGLSAFGALIELVQGTPLVHRDAQLLDWVADTVAAVAVLAFMALLSRIARRRS
jgi:hypothetical protein